MAEYLASIFGTEKDKVNCSFYFKIGACRHGDRCSRIHNKPTFSQVCIIAISAEMYRLHISGVVCSAGRMMQSLASKAASTMRLKDLRFKKIDQLQSIIKRHGSLGQVFNY
ncbi:PREDICTED: uncharacterized protein LOC105454406 [Wasmannia auropunctata]|uniref:uncharacterized protein LOC105454406 n=1 Tax=Wasmannia auropunctata TaxID=64793 RepID=UPI0005EDE794|nr:PREDICTED: uncharacterized protein LOC105454406 [Wasmannia auropunctata]